AYVSGRTEAIDDLLDGLAHATAVFESHTDYLGLARAHATYGDIAWAECHVLESAARWRKALAYAEMVEDRSLIQLLREQIVLTYTHGPTPAEEAASALEAILDESTGLLQVEAAVRRALGRIAAMRGDVETGRELFRSGREPLAEMGLAYAYAAVGQGIAFIERMAGDLAAEEAELRRDLDMLEKLDERSFSSTAAALLAKCLTDQ